MVPHACIQTRDLALLSMALVLHAETLADHKHQLDLTEHGQLHNVVRAALRLES